MRGLSTTFATGAALVVLLACAAPAAFAQCHHCEDPECSHAGTAPVNAFEKLFTCPDERVEVANPSLAPSPHPNPDRELPPTTMLKSFGGGAALGYGVSLLYKGNAAAWAANVPIYGSWYGGLVAVPAHPVVVGAVSVETFVAPKFAPDGYTQTSQIGFTDFNSPPRIRHYVNYLAPQPYTHPPIYAPSPSAQGSTIADVTALEEVTGRTISFE